MSERFFLISVDWDHPDLDAAGFRAFIRDGKLCTKWWNHIPTLFIVCSDESAETIAERLRPFTRSASLLVMGVNPSNSEGSLTDRGWDWIRRASGELVPLGR